MYPHTKERAERIESYEHDRRVKEKPKPQIKSAIAHDTPPDAALKQYIKAKELVDKLASRFVTEYQRQFLDWTQFVKMNEDLETISRGTVQALAKEGIVHQPNNHLETSIEQKSPKTEDIQPAIQTQTLSTQTAKPITPMKFETGVQVSPFKEPEIAKEKKTEPLKKAKVKEATKNEAIQKETVKESTTQTLHSEPKILIDPLPFVTQIVPAGTSSQHSLAHEKRHYSNQFLHETQQLWKTMADTHQKDVLYELSKESPDVKRQRQESSTSQVLRYALQDPATYSLAHELLKKSQQRSESLARKK